MTESKLFECFVDETMEYQHFTYKEQPNAK